MKNFLIGSAFLATLLMLPACQLEKVDPETPVNTFETTFNTAFFNKRAFMSLQTDGNIRVISNEAFGFDSYQPIAFILDSDNNGAILSKKYISPMVDLGALVPTDFGSYYVSYSKDSANMKTLGLLVMNPDGSIANDYESLGFPYQFTSGSSLQTYLFKNDAFHFILCGNTEDNDSLHIMSFYPTAPGAPEFDLTAEIPDCQGACMLKTQDGGFLVCGIGANGNVRLVKLNADLDIIEWNNNGYGGNFSFWSWAVQTADGGYFVCNDSGGLLKTDSNGNQQWNAPANPDKRYHFILEVQDGNYLLCGSNNWKAYVAKVAVDNSGMTILWEKTFEDGSNFEHAVETPDKGFLMIGPSVDPGIHLVKTDQLGNVY